MRAARRSKTDTARAIRTLDFDNPKRPDLSIEVLSFAELLRKAPPGAFSRPMRPTFHQVIVPARGRVPYDVDFERHLLGPGVAAWAQPGQVQRLGLQQGAEGWLVLFTADVLDLAGAGSPWGAPSPRVVLAPAGTEERWLLERMHRLTAGLGDEWTRPLARHLLLSLLLMLKRAAHRRADERSAHQHDVFALFQGEVEARFAKTRRLRDYERITGYSSKTLGRATARATGQTAKKYLDQRVLLEARRLLAHTSMGIGEVAAELGFTELTNFVKFFRREGRGESPSAFRARVRPAQ
jgi:AraC-like DNA-binding protein